MHRAALHAVCTRAFLGCYGGMVVILSEAKNPGVGSLLQCSDRSLRSE